MLIYNFQDFEEMFVHLSIPLCDQGNLLHLYRVHNLPLKVDGGGGGDIAVDDDVADDDDESVDQGNQLHLYRVHNNEVDGGNDDIDITTLTIIPNDDTGKVRDGYSVTADLDTEYLLTAK